MPGAGKISRPRTRPRVEDTEDKTRTPKKRTMSKRATGSPDDKLSAGVTMEGNIKIYVQRSELTPIAQYANVSIGPVALEFTIGGIDLTPLMDVKPDQWTSEEDNELVFDYASLTPEQKRIYDQVQAILGGVGAMLENRLNDDREIVETSVRMRNAKDAEETKARKR
jgi:hypothetical protein